MFCSFVSKMVLLTPISWVDAPRSFLWIRMYFDDLGGWSVSHMILWNDIVQNSNTVICHFHIKHQRQGEDSQQGNREESKMYIAQSFLQQEHHVHDSQNLDLTGNAPHGFRWGQTSFENFISQRLILSLGSWTPSLYCTSLPLVTSRNYNLVRAKQSIICFTKFWYSCPQVEPRTSRIHIQAAWHLYIESKRLWMS